MQRSKIFFYFLEKYVEMYNLILNFKFCNKTINMLRNIWYNFEILNYHKWRSPSLNELTPIMFDMELTHLGSKTTKCHNCIYILWRKKIHVNIFLEWDLFSWLWFNCDRWRWELILIYDAKYTYDKILYGGLWAKVS